MYKQAFLTCALFAALVASDVQAGFTAAVTPGFRGAQCTRYAGWETFTSAYGGANLPDDLGTSATAAALTQLVPGAILTSTGNIYHPAQAPAFELADVAPEDVQEVVLQTSTYGNSRSAGSFMLTYANGQGQDIVLSPTEFVALVQIPQQHDELYFRWDLTAVADVVLAYRLSWFASAANMSLDAVLLDVRHACAPGTAFCFGDGTGSVCPCGNGGVAGNGCANSLNPAGANLGATGYASIAADSVVLQGGGMPDSTCLYFQGTTQQSGGAGASFGDGLRCAGGAVVRLGTATNAGGASAYPVAGQQPVSVRGGVAAGEVRTYQAWYRNAASFCTSATFNVSNGWEIAWIP